MPTGINVERNPEREFDAPVAVPDPAVLDVLEVDYFENSSALLFPALKSR